MSAPKNGIRRLPTCLPLQPRSSAGEQFTAATQPKSQVEIENLTLRRLMDSEQKKANHVQRILLKANAALERNLTDLRELLISQTARDLVRAGR
jgi:hypothetical protein